jgi:hypothetical protein
MMLYVNLILFILFIVEQGYCVRVTHVGRVAPRVVAIEVTGADMTYGGVAEYVPTTGDVVERPDPYITGDGGGSQLWLTNAGETPSIVAAIGEDPTGAQRRKAFDVVSGDRVVEMSVETLGSWTGSPLLTRVGSAAHPHRRGYVGGYSDTDMPENTTQIGEVLYWTLKTFVYLEVEEGAGPTIALQNDDAGIPLVNWTFDPLTSRSRAVSVRHIGFLPTEPKYAFISSWAGTLGGLTLSTDLGWSLVRVGDSTIVADGQLAERTASDSTDIGAPLYTADFSAFSHNNRSASYRLCVQDIGCSHDFPIHRSVLTPLVSDLFGGLNRQLNHRPVTIGNVTRTALHGVSFYQSTSTYPQAHPGTEEVQFSVTADGEPTAPCDAEWSGGWQDAGDWDVRSPHLLGVSLMLSLWQRHGDTLEGLQVADSRSSVNGVPGALDAVLAGLDAFVGAQLTDGSVGGGYETTRHPRIGETSDFQGTRWFCFAPDPYSTLLLAAAAASASVAVAPYNTSMSASYLSAAEAAWTYGVARWDSSAEIASVPASYTSKYEAQLEDAATAAAAALYLATNQTVAAYADFWIAHARCLAGQSLVGDDHEQVVSTFEVVSADVLEAAAQTPCTTAVSSLGTAFGAASVSGTGYMHATPSFLSAFQHTANLGNVWLAMAGELEPDNETLVELLGLSHSYVLGANPLSIPYVTGIPSDLDVLEPTRADSYGVRGSTVPPGIIIVGPVDVSQSVYNFSTLPQFPVPWLGLPEQPGPLHPANEVDWPRHRYFSPSFGTPLVGEWTVHQNTALFIYSLATYATRMIERGEADPVEWTEPEATTTSTTSGTSTTTTSTTLSSTTSPLPSGNSTTSAVPATPASAGDSSSAASGESALGDETIIAIVAGVLVVGLVMLVGAACVSQRRRSKASSDTELS